MQPTSTSRKLKWLGVAAFAAWALAGVRSIPADGAERVASFAPLPFGPRAVSPGLAWLPAGLARVTVLPATAEVTLVQGAAPPVVSREGARFDLQGGRAIVRFEKGRARDAFEALGADWQAGLSARVIEAARRAVQGEGTWEPSALGLAALGRALQPALEGELAATGVTLVSLRLGAAASSPAAQWPRRDTGIRLLVIGLDAADWSLLDPLLDAGRMPRLAALVESGSRSRLRTISPVLSPVIWTSVATGQAPDRHGILDFMMLDPSGRLRPVSSSERKVRALWNILSEAGLPSTFVGWWATWPAEPVHGVMITDRVAYQVFKLADDSGVSAFGKVFPPEVAPVIGALAVEPEAVAEADIARYLVGGSKSPAARRHPDLVEQLATAIAAEKTYLAATLAMMRERPATVTAPYFESPDVVAHLFMSHRPPRMEGVAADEVAAFGQAVDRFWAHQDEVIGALLDAAGPETTVVICSDHGFKMGANRPRGSSLIGGEAAALWHDAFGIVVLSGPGIRRGATIQDPSVLDITPTLLALLGLPIAEDMDGRPLTEALDPAFLGRHPVATIPTYDAQPLARVAAPSDAPDEGTLEKLVALGYVGSQRESPADGGSKVPPHVVAAEASRWRFHSALASMDAGRLDEAARELRLAAAPDVPPAERARALYTLARVRGDQGDDAEAEAALATACALTPDDAEPWYWRARLALGAGNVDAAAEHVERALALEPASAPSLVLRAKVHSARGRDDQAEKDARRAAEIDPERPEGWVELARLASRQGRTAEAEAHLRTAVAADAQHGPALVALGDLLGRTGRAAEGLEVLRKATSVLPHSPAVWNGLALALRKQGDLAGAEAALRSGLAKAPTAPVLLNNLGDILIRSGRAAESLPLLQSALEKAPRDPWVSINLGAALGETGRVPESVPHLRRATELAPNLPEAWLSLSRALAETGQPDEAAAAAARAASLRAGAGGGGGTPRTP